MLGITTLTLSWRFPALRIQGIMLTIAAGVAFMLTGYPTAVKAYTYLALDVGAGFVAYQVWRKYREPTAIGFLALSMVCVCAHWALFYVNPENPNPWIATLNIIYIIMCVMVGGSGYARRNRHLFSLGGADSVGQHADKGAW